MRALYSSQRNLRHVTCTEFAARNLPHVVESAARICFAPKKLAQWVLRRRSRSSRRKELCRTKLSIVVTLSECVSLLSPAVSLLSPAVGSSTQVSQQRFKQMLCAQCRRVLPTDAVVETGQLCTTCALLSDIGREVRRCAPHVEPRLHQVLRAIVQLACAERQLLHALDQAHASFTERGGTSTRGRSRSRSPSRHRSDEDWSPGYSPAPST